MEARLGNIIRQHGINVHCYADDTQLYLSMKPEETEKLVKLQICLKDLKDRLDHMITLDGISLTSSLSVRNLGVTFDQNLSFNSHIKLVSRSAFFHLRNITKIRKLLTRHDAEKLVHAFVTSRLDYCNSLLSGCPNNSLSLQLIQNAAARVLTGQQRDGELPAFTDFKSKKETPKGANSPQSQDTDDRDNTDDKSHSSDRPGEHTVISGSDPEQRPGALQVSVALCPSVKGGTITVGFWLRADQTAVCIYYCVDTG
ncbi:hypothetical protein D4764_10G0011600 [Takifugu flavidus]|uniref:Reverse transcriptase domain-containing protein n=1 Tax=Takifugu flavidus TaxID=433684 RepID=A0A5C6PPE2_9TELE|nr:hypothetical protein D4764_10G0011600 [Takifugu flavidus]